jgi:hypothetical protein
MWKLTLGRVLPPPLLGALHPLEPLSGLGELQDGVAVVDLVGDVLVLAGVLPVTLEGGQESGFVEHGGLLVQQLPL